VGRLEVTKTAFGVSQWARSLKCLKKHPKTALCMLVKDISEVLGFVDGDRTGGAVTGAGHADDVLEVAKVLCFEVRA
jgi:hypothetical protein